MPAMTEAALRRAPDGDGALRRLDSAELFGGRKAVEIVHRGEVYTLRLTRAGKLLLTK